MTVSIENVLPLECGISAGPDGVSAEVIKFSQSRSVILLSLLFTSRLSHGDRPRAMIETTSVLIVKKNVAVSQIAILILYLLL